MADELKKKNEVRFCKKCGAELPGTEKSKLCINCRRKRGERIRNTAFAIAIAVGSAFLGKEHIRKPIDDSDDNTDEGVYDEDT